MVPRNRYKGGNKAKTKDELFSPYLSYYVINPRLKNAKGYTEDFLRKEYTRMRDIAMKRLKRMEGHSNADWILEQHPEGFPRLRDITKGMTKESPESREAVVKALVDVTNFLTAKRSSVSGIDQTEKSTAQQLSEKTGVQITPEQIGNFGRFFNTIKKELGIKSGHYPSDQEVIYVAEVWDALQNGGKITKKKMREAVQNYLDGYTGEHLEETERIADRIAHRVTNYFDIERIDKRSTRTRKKR